MAPATVRKKLVLLTTLCSILNWLPISFCRTWWHVEYSCSYFFHFLSCDLDPFKLPVSDCLSLQTRVLVTHGAHWLPLVDSIIVLDGGRVTETGTYEDLMAQGGAFSEFIRTYLLGGETAGHSEDEDPDSWSLLPFFFVLSGILTQKILI